MGQKKRRTLIKSQGLDAAVNDDNILNYKSKRKLKILAKSAPLPTNHNPTSVIQRMSNHQKHDKNNLPAAVIDTLSLADRMSRVNNPMPKKSLMRSVDKTKLHNSIKQRKLQKQNKRESLSNDKNETPQKPKPKFKTQ